MKIFFKLWNIFNEILSLLNLFGNNNKRLAHRFLYMYDRFLEPFNASKLNNTFAYLP